MKYLLSILISVLLFTGCKYLDMVPEKDIETVETVFERRVNAQEWWKGLYGQMIKLFSTIASNTSFVGSDEFVTCEIMRNKGWAAFKIPEGQQMSQSPYGATWGTSYIIIRNCNTFLENIDNVYNMEDWEKQQWKADVQALKAYMYFELVRRYGPIALVPENISADADIKVLQLPRQHVDTCFNEIIRLLDAAAKYVPVGNTRVSDDLHSFSQESVAALKARVLLYVASPLFNGNPFYSDFKGKNGEPLFSAEYDREKWRLAAEAADEAAKICEANGRRLYGGQASKTTELLNKMDDIENIMYSSYSNPEYLFEFKRQQSVWFDSYIMPRLINDSKNYDSRLFGALSPSMKMVEMYYTEHGLPIDADNAWNYAGRYQMGTENSSLYQDVVPLNTQVLQLHLRREPRFYASIAADRLYWQRGISDNYNDYKLLVSAYKGESWGTSLDIISSNDYQNINGYWLKKHTFSKWKTYGYLSNITNDNTIPLIRLAEVYMIQAEAWNEYLDKPDSRVYDPLNKVRERAGILDVVSAWRSYSKTPNKVNTKEGMREIIRQENNIEFAFEGHRYWNLRRWRIAHELLNEKQYGWNILGESARVFYNNFNGPVVVWSKCKFTAPRDYLDPIDAEEILISSMVQNPGW